MNLIFTLGSGTSFRARVRVRYVGMCSWQIRFLIESGEVLMRGCVQNWISLFCFGGAYLKGILRKTVPRPVLEVSVRVLQSLQAGYCYNYNVNLPPN